MINLNISDLISDEIKSIHYENLYILCELEQYYDLNKYDYEEEYVFINLQIYLMNQFNNHGKIIR